MNTCRPPVWEQPPSTDSLSGRRLSCSWDCSFSFRRRVLTFIYLLFIKLTSADTGAGTMKKLAKIPRLTCWECFLGNGNVWSWSQQGSLCDSHTLTLLSGTNRDTCSYLCNLKPCQQAIPCVVKRGLTKGPTPFLEHGTGHTRPGKWLAKSTCPFQEGWWKEGRRRLLTPHPNHLLLHSLLVKLEPAICSSWS